MVDWRRESRTWDPVGERARVWIGCSDGGEGGKRRALMSFRRKGMVFEGVGRSADWIMWEVVV